MRRHDNIIDRVLLSTMHNAPRHMGCPAPHGRWSDQRWQGWKILRRSFGLASQRHRLDHVAHCTLRALELRAAASRA